MQELTVFYYVYKLTNLVNGKIYVGVHKTTDLDDGYMGSGFRLARAKAKHGLESFKKEILMFADSTEELLEIESLLVDESFLRRSDVFNIMPGGKGGWHHVNATGRNGTHKGVDARLSLHKQEQWQEAWKRKQAEGLTAWATEKPDDYWRQVGIKAGESCKARTGAYSFEGKQHTEEAKQKIGAANSVHQKGSQNSQFGTMWITDGITSKKISKGAPIPVGWRKGRICK